MMNETYLVLLMQNLNLESIFYIYTLVDNIFTCGSKLDCFIRPLVHFWKLSEYLWFCNMFDKTSGMYFNFKDGSYWF